MDSTRERTPNKDYCGDKNSQQDVTINTSQHKSSPYQTTSNYSVMTPLNKPNKHNYTTETPQLSTPIQKSLNTLQKQSFQLKVALPHERRLGTSPYNYNHHNNRYDPYNTSRYLNSNCDIIPNGFWPKSYDPSPLQSRALLIPPDNRASSQRRIQSFHQRRASMQQSTHQRSKKRKNKRRPFQREQAPPPPPLPEDPSKINIWKMNPNDSRRNPRNQWTQTNPSIEEPLRPLNEVIKEYLSNWGSQEYKASLATGIFMGTEPKKSSTTSSKTTLTASAKSLPLTGLSTTTTSSLTSQVQRHDNTIGIEVQEWPDESNITENDRLFGQGWWANRVSRWNNAHQSHSEDDDEQDGEEDEEDESEEDGYDEAGHRDEDYHGGDSTAGTDDDDLNQLYSLYHGRDNINNHKISKAQDIPESEEIDMELDEAFGEAFADMPSQSCQATKYNTG